MILVPELQLAMLDHEMHDVSSLINILLGIDRVVRFKPVLGNGQPQVHFVFVFDWLISLFNIHFL